eukprot:TRINITY_DN12922_c1_g1_i1.p1 TRINITY_DN12922_c1_g1~~TRINITY_DN12922_c1_g1_i1.p1  ORF type:complete len:1518 (-),score=320.21 TRINITY_DN12922_c1_g1_i1:128-4651(-)
MPAMSFLALPWAAATTPSSAVQQSRGAFSPEKLSGLGAGSTCLSSAMQAAASGSTPSAAAATSSSRLSWGGNLARSRSPGAAQGGAKPQRKTEAASSRRDGAGVEDQQREEMKVVVRLRPPMDPGNPLAYFAEKGERTKLLAHMPADSGASPSSASRASGASAAAACGGGGGSTVEELTFSHVVTPSEGTDQMFESLGMRQLIAGVARGFQETVFAYGQTGSGKTHTILGSAGGERGLLQLCTLELFRVAFGEAEGKAGDLRRRIQLVCLEIKGDDIHDLLPPAEATQSSGATPPPAMRSSAVQQRSLDEEDVEMIHVKGRRLSARRVTVWSYHEAMALLGRAIASREVGSSNINSESSRSHMVVRFTVKISGMTRGSGVAGSLSLVDLAGNERDSNCPNGTAINVSLTHLNRMLVKMQEGQLDESDRRQSALNMVLYEQLREDCGVTMVFCIHPERRHAASARSTLQMATLCRKIIQRKRIRRFEVTDVQEELASLRSEATKLSLAHSEAIAAQQAKEQELQKTTELLRDLKLRYEEKSKDFEVLRKNLEQEFRRLSKEGSQQQEVVSDLEQRNEALARQVGQLQLVQQAQELREDKELTSRPEAQPPLLAVTPVVDRCSAGESLEDHCQELERAYRHELQAVHEAYGRQLRTLKEAMGQRPATPVKAGHPKEALASESGVSTQSSCPAAREACFQPQPAPSSLGEPCSEPSMYSGHEGGFADGDAFSYEACDEASTTPGHTPRGRTYSQAQLPQAELIQPDVHKTPVKGGLSSSRDDTTTPPRTPLKASPQALLKVASPQRGSSSLMHSMSSAATRILSPGQDTAAAALPTRSWVPSPTHQQQQQQQQVSAVPLAASGSTVFRGLIQAVQSVGAQTHSPQNARYSLPVRAQAPHSPTHHARSPGPRATLQVQPRRAQSPHSPPFAATAAAPGGSLFSPPSKQAAASIHAELQQVRTISAAPSQASLSWLPAAAPKIGQASALRADDASASVSTAPRGDASDLGASGASGPAMGRAQRAVNKLLTVQPGSLSEIESIEATAAQLARFALQGRLEKELWPQGCTAGLRVMHLLPQSPVVQRDGAILLSELANKDSALKDLVAARGGMTLAVSALRWLVTVPSSTMQRGEAGARPVALAPAHQQQQQQLLSEACSACFRLLAVLCQRHSSRQASISELGGLQLCLQCMARPDFGRSLDAAIHGCWLLMAMCYKHPSNQDQVRVAGGVALVMKLLENQVSALEALGPSSPVDSQAATLCAYAAGFLACVAESNEASRQVIFDGDGIRILLSALQACLQSPHVVANTCVAVAHLAYLHEPSQQAARAQGGVMSILRALQTYRGHGPVQGSICRAIAVLSEGPCSVSQQAFLAARLPDGRGGETGVVALLVQALRDLSQDASLVTTAAWALSNLVLDSPEAADHVCTIRGPETAVALLRGPLGCQERPCEYLCRFLSRLASGSSHAAQRSRLALQGLGAVDVLRQTGLHFAASEGDAIRNVKEALQVLQES